MAKANHCAKNERIKRRYMHYLKEAKGYSPASVDMAAAAINRFEVHTGYRDFQKFHVEQARAFKRHLSEGVIAVKSGKNLSKATIFSTLRSLRAFFLWLADQPGYRSAIRYSDAAYLSPAGQDERIATADRRRPVPEISEIEQALRTMPATTELELRDRAVIAFILLTGVRDRAAASLKLKHVNLVKGILFQDAREVRTKRAKTFKTKFFPVGELSLGIVTEWVCFLQDEKGFGPKDPLFPATRLELDSEQQFASAGLDRKHWTTTTPIRKILKGAFTGAGLPYYNPHSFRSTLTRLGERVCRTQEDFKSWSQNLGHEKVTTALSSYGKVDEARQLEIIGSLGQQTPANDDLVEEFAAFMRDRRLSKG